MDIIRPTFTAADLAQLPDDGERYEVLEGDLTVSPHQVGNINGLYTMSTHG